MIVNRSVTCACVAALALYLGAETTASQSDDGPYFVVFKSATLPDDAIERIVAAGGQAHFALPEIGALSVSGDDDFLAAIAGDPDVLAAGPQRLHAVPDLQLLEPSEESPDLQPTDPSEEDAQSIDAMPLPGDTEYAFQWNLRRIGAPDVWARFPLPTQGRRPIVAVLDTGVAHNHPDLAGQILVSKATSFCNTPGGPGNLPGYPRYSTLIDFDAHPVWTPADGCTVVPPMMSIVSGHGTHVAGIIGARFGGGRIVGVAPEARIAVYKVFDRFRFTDPALGRVDTIGAFDGPILMAIVDAVNSGYPVINMSLGSLIVRSIKSHKAVWHAYDRVVKYANQRGTLIVASAGNDGLNLNGPVANLPSDLSTVVSTSATGISALAFSGGAFVPAAGARDVLAPYSNYGAAVDIAAPGGDCGPTFPSVCQGQYAVRSSWVFNNAANGYVSAFGTSMAAPHVAAVAAMVRAIHPDWTPGDVRSHLKETVEKIGRRQSFGHGLVNAALAVQ